MTSLSIRLVFAFASIAATILPASAQDIPPPPAAIADLVETCKACHGADGVPVQEDAPIIWGQENYYMYIQLRDIKAGRRASEIMQPNVADLEKDTLKALAEYFSTLPWPALHYQTPEADIAAGEQVAVAGQCPQCHLGKWTGNSRVPRLAGQNVKYLEKTMLDFKHGRRLNAPDIAALFKDMSDDALSSMARYVAGK